MLLSYFIHLSEIFITNNTTKLEVAVVVGGGGGGGGGRGGGGGEFVLGTFFLLFKRQCFTTIKKEMYKK